MMMNIRKMGSVLILNTTLPPQPSSRRSLAAGGAPPSYPPPHLPPSPAPPVVRYRHRQTGRYLCFTRRGKIRTYVSIRWRMGGHGMGVAEGRCLHQIPPSRVWLVDVAG